MEKNKLFLQEDEVPKEDTSIEEEDEESDGENDDASDAKDGSDSDEES